MKRGMSKKILLFICTIIVLIFTIYPKSIADESEETVGLQNLEQLMKKRNIGETIEIARDTSQGTSNTYLSENDFLYCFQHSIGCEKSKYKVQQYIEIDGDKATRYYRKDTTSEKDVFSNSNLALGYILAHENYKKGWKFNGEITPRQRALWYYGDTWLKEVGSEYRMSGSTNDHKDYIEPNNISKEAETYAAKGPIKDPVITFNKNEGYLNTTNGSVFGPFRVSFNDDYDRIHITSIDANDINGKKIASRNISFYTDSSGNKSIDAKNITKNTVFYIKNTSNNDVTSITVNVETDKIYKAQMWVLCSSKNSSQRLLVVKPDYYTKKASATLKITSTGSLYIFKKDKENGDTLKGAGFKIYKKGEGWLKGTTSPYEFTNKLSEATEYTMDNKNKGQFIKYMKYDGSREEYIGKMTLKIDGLRSGTYHIYETKAPNGGYDLKLQDGYDAKNNYVDTGIESVIGGDREGGGHNWNRLVSISNTNTILISISGYVWVDKVPVSKVTDSNNLCEENETKVSGVIVRLMKKGNKPTEVSSIITGNDGSYVFKDLINKNSLKDYYIEFNYSGTEYKKYIPVAFNATSTNGSKAIVQNMPEYDKDFQGIATTYTGTNDNTKEKQYGLEKCGTYDERTKTLQNINLGIKQIPKPVYDIKESIATVKITMKGFTYTYVYDGEGGESRIYAPKVTYQGRNDITAYKRSFYPTDIAYDKVNNTEELKAEVKYRIDVTNTENTNMETAYKEQAMYLKQLVNNFDADRYTLADSEHWKAGEVTTDSNGKKRQTATINDNYLKSIYDQSLGIQRENTATAYINFSVNHDAILDILNHPDGIIEEFPTQAVATAYHKYSRNDYSWANNILKEQTHYTEDEDRNANAPYLIFTLGKDRTITGKVFEDKVITDNGEKLGNGTNEQDESAVTGVKVELLDATKDEIADVTKLSVSNLYTAEGEESAPRKEVSKTAIVDTDENGNYTLKGVVPGYYVIRYTYGDGTQEYTDYKGNKISVDIESKLRNSDGQEKTVYAKDYKSTIVTSQVAKNALENSNENTYTWYRRLEGENYSIAIDSLNERKALNKDTGNNIIDDSKENTKENEKTIINAGTAKMLLSIENNDTDTENVEITDGKQEEKSQNEIKGINFGIIEQPIQQAKVEKVITYVTLTNSQNNVVFDGNPENAKMQGVSDLDNQQNGGSIYVRAEVLEDIIYSSKLELDYEIRVTNVSDVNYYEDNYYLYGDKNGAHEITLKVNEVTDYLDETLKYLPKKSDKNRVSTEIKSMKLDDRNVQVIKLNKWDDVLFTNKVNDDSRKTTDKVTIVAERTLSREDKDMEIINEAEITSIKHATETGNTEEEKLKIAPSEVHTNGRVKVVTSITPPTGENKQLGVYYAIAGIVTLVLLSAGIVIIKKKIK